MNSIKTKSRLHAVKMMYQWEITGDIPENITAQYWKSVDEKNTAVKENANKLFTDSMGKVEWTDSLFKKLLKKGWSFDRLGEIEKSVLRVAIYDILNNKIPEYAANNDYATITRKYVDEKTASFVHGILQSVEKELLQENEQ